MTTPPRPALLLACALALCAVETAQAQDSLYRILVGDEGGRCTYEIDGHTDQDEFVIEPGGIIVFDPVGSVAGRVTVLSDDTSGLGGAEGNDVYILSRGKSVAVDIRPALGRETVHGLEIECCARGTSVNRCRQWTRAVPKAVPDVSRSLPAAPDTTADGIPVSATQTMIMGPRMKVGN